MRITTTLPALARVSILVPTMVLGTAEQPGAGRRCGSPGEVGPDHDPQHPERMFLPPDLFDPTSPWVWFHVTTIRGIDGPKALRGSGRPGGARRHYPATEQ